MDLSKAFDCIPHNLSIAKCSAYGFDKTALKYIYSLLYSLLPLMVTSTQDIRTRPFTNIYNLKLKMLTS